MTVRIINADCIEALRAMPAASVQCVVTSPPYWGLRSYGIGKENGELGLESSPDCGRPLMKLRVDLSDKQRQMVLRRLTELALI